MATRGEMGRIKVLKVDGRPDVVELNVDGQPYYLPGTQAMKLGETLLNAGVDAKLAAMGTNPQGTQH